MISAMTTGKRLLLAILCISIAFSTVSPPTALAAGTITLSPTSGIMDTVITITVTGNGFQPSASGYVWFDTNGDSVKNATEPQVLVTVNDTGAIPANTTLDTPLLPPYKTYSVRADIPTGTPIEANALFTTSIITTSVTVTKLASDGTTVLNKTTVNYSWMRDNLPVMGEENLNGTNYTHHYFQGPTFDEDNEWDQSESVNVTVDSRDYGAVAGTDIKDLCELVGGMSPGDEVKIKSPDGFNKWFNYTNVYNNRANETLNSRQGPMVLAWYNGEESLTGELQGVGYPGTTGYYQGMRLYFFADNSTNPRGYRVFGLWDMHECLAEEYWHYYYDNGTYWPSSSGLSVKWISDIIIYSNEPPPLCGDVDCDGYVTTADVYPVFKRASAHEPVCSDWAADVDCDGYVTTADVYPVFKNASAHAPLYCCT